MVRIDVEYRGGLRCQARHDPSGMELTTDAPTDNHGRGEAFSPTDLVATAFVTCISTIMGIYAEREAVVLEGMRATVRKIMSEDSPRRIARLEVGFRMPPGIPPGHREGLERCATTCPVRHSIHPGIDVEMTFSYPDEAGRV